MAELTTCPCIFCYKKVSTVTIRNGDDNSPKFLQLLAQYLDIQIKTRVDVTDGHFLSCDDCFKLVNTFCDLFVQWENLRLQLDWMVRQLFEVMRAPKIVSSSHPEFGYQCQNEEDLDGNVVYQKIQKLINELLNGSAKHLSSSLPKLVLKKIPVEEDEESEGVIGTVPQSDGETEFDNSGLPNCQSNSNGEVYEERQVEAQMIDRIEDNFSLTIISEQEAIDAGKAVTLIDKQIGTDHLVDDDDELKDKDEWGEIPRSQGGDVHPSFEVIDREDVGVSDVIVEVCANGTTSPPITIDKTDKNQELLTNSGLGKIYDPLFETRTKDELMAFLAILHLSLPLHPKAVVPKNYHKKRRRKKRIQLNATKQVTTDLCASNPNRHCCPLQNELDEQGRLPNSSLNAEQLLVEQVVSVENLVKDGDRETQMVDRIQENFSLKMIDESDAVLASETVSFADKQIQTDQPVYNNCSEFVKGWEEAANAQDNEQSSSKLTDREVNGTASEVEKVECCQNERLRFETVTSSEQEAKAVLVSDVVPVSKRQQKRRTIWVENQQLQIDLPIDYDNSDVEYELEVIVKVEEMESPPPNMEFQVEDEMNEMNDHDHDHGAFENEVSSILHPERDMDKGVQTSARACNLNQPNNGDAYDDGTQVDTHNDETDGSHSQVAENNAQDSSSVPNVPVEVEVALNSSLDGEQSGAMVDEVTFENSIPEAVSTVSTLKSSQVNEQISEEAVEVGRGNDNDQVEADLTSKTDDAFTRETTSEQEVVSVGESSLTSNFSGAEKQITHITCPICSTSIDSPFLLTLHLRCFHKIKIPFKCPLCKHECATTPLFNQHMKRAHGTATALIGPFQCKICLERFSTLKFLKIHKFRIHKRPQCGPDQIKRKNEKGTHKKKSSTKNKQDLEIFGKSSFSRAGRNSVIAKLVHDDDQGVPELGASVEIESHNEKFDQLHDTIWQTDKEIEASQKGTSPSPGPSYMHFSTYDNSTGGHPNKNASATSYTPVQDHNYSRMEVPLELEPRSETNENVLMNETKQHKPTQENPEKLAIIPEESSSPLADKKKESKPVASSSSSSLASSSRGKKLPTTCHVCGSSFKTPVLLTLHLRSVHYQLQTPFKCPYCSYQCSVSRGYKIHMRLVHNTNSGLPGLFRCKTCKERFDHRQVLLKHTRVHQKTRTQQPTGLKCGICSQVFKTKAKLLAHTSSCRRFKCSFATCSKSFTSKKHLKRHGWTHTSNAKKVKQNKPRSWSYRRRKGFHCLWANCSSKFFSASSLHSHVNLKHEGNETPPPPAPSNECHECQIQFDSPALLALHLTCHEKRVDSLPNENEREKSVASEQQSQALESPTIEKEIETGSPKIVDVFSLSNGELPLPSIVQDAQLGPSTSWRKCHKCPSSFETRVLLTLHLRSAHKSKSRFKCPQCRVRIFNTTCFRTHMNSVHNTISGLPGRLQCELCQERFCHRRALAKHIPMYHPNDHSDPASFKCEECRQDFETQAQLELHQCQVNEEIQTTTVQSIAPPLASSSATSEQLSVTSTTSMENNCHESPQPVNPQRPRNRKCNLKESGSTYTKRGPV